MKIHRFIGDYKILEKGVKITDLEIVKQIQNVLKLKKGEKIVLSDGKSINMEILLSEIKDKEILGEIIKSEKIQQDARKVILYLAILKKENFELATQKAVEVGVHKIVPIITERTIKTGLNFVRLEKIIKEASEQSGKNILPTLADTLNFKEALEDGKNSDEKIIFDLNNKEYEPNKNSKNISIFIGPEGGFTEKEVETAKNLKYNIYSLGKLTMRGETASTIATYRAVNGI